MSLELAINNALSGLNVNQKALSVVSQNIANANTEGYSRKTIDQSAIVIGGVKQVGAGVRVDDIVRKIDTYLLRTIRSQSSLSANTKTVDDYMERVQVMLGEPGDVNTLDEYVETFFNNVQKLAESPESISLREAAVDGGITLAREIEQLAVGIEDLRLQADQDYATNIRTLNNLLVELDSINTAISNAMALSNPISSLQDEQDMIIQDIAEIIDIDTLQQDNNEIYIYANGKALLDDFAYEIDYKQIYAVENLVEQRPIDATLIYRLDNNGNRVNPPEQLVSAGVEGGITSDIKAGKLRAFMDLRDKGLPDVLQQLDQLAEVVRDTFNEVHNTGSSYPGTNELLGTRAVSGRDSYDWQGGIRIAVLDKNGQPIDSPYSNEAHTGVRALDLDFTTLESGLGKGKPTVQTILDEINNHFHPPTTKVAVGNVNNIELVSITDQLPSTNPPPKMEFDFEVENISGLDAEFFVSNITVLDNNGVDITSVTDTAPKVQLNAVNGFITTAGSKEVTISASNHGFSAGDVIFVPEPAAAINGIPTNNFGRYFKIGNVTAGTFTIGTDIPATATGGVTGGGLEVRPRYDKIEAGKDRRTNEQGSFTADFSGNPNAAYYDVQVTVGVNNSSITSDDEVKTSTITYRIPNFQRDLRNDRYDHIAITGGGERNFATITKPYARAILVDEKGNELPKSNGVYANQEGFLKIVTEDEDYTVSIEDLGSKQLGDLEKNVKGTNRGFSHFFELNNFFASNKPTATGDTRKNSAINMAIEQRFEDNANLISLGTLERSNQSANPNDPPIYTYERFSGTNDTIQKLAKLSIDIQEFEEAGGMDSSSQTINGYISEMLGFLANSAATAGTQARDNDILLSGFTERMDAAKGVNIDEELANTVIYQNAYNASARIISVTNEMFDALFDAV
jgi:flagellar hook-associated protein FlgK